MKKIKLFIIVLISLFVINVKADMGPPSVAEHEVVVTNKNGAVCYEYSGAKYTKSNVTIPYKTTLSVIDDINDSYISVFSDVKEYNCTVKYSDVSAKTQSFNLKSAKEITPVKAVILAKGGLNMRVGPAVTYSKIITIPQYAVVTLTHKSGSYWYYCKYGDKSGWITGMNGYFGYEGKEVLYFDEDVVIIDSYNNGKKIGTIPANTEITDYLNIVSRGIDYEYYVSYNGVKGFVRKMYYKTDGTGKIKLVKDVEIRNEAGELTKKLLANQELEYTMMNEYGEFYIPSKKLLLSVKSDEFEYVTKADVKVKTSGYIGEGLFGEKNNDNNTITPASNETNNGTEEQNEESKNDIPNNEGMSTKDIIIICLLAGIFLSLTAIVVIKLVNSKKSKPVVVNNINNENKEL